MQRLLQSFLEKFDRLPREQCGNHRALSHTDDFTAEKQQRKQERKHHARYVKGDFHIAEGKMRFVGNRFDERLARIHNHIGNHRQGNAKAENGCPCKHQKQANGIQFSGNQSRKPHTEIRKPAEQYGKGYLQ